MGLRSSEQGRLRRCYILHRIERKEAGGKVRLVSAINIHLNYKTHTNSATQTKQLVLFVNVSSTTAIPSHLVFLVLKWLLCTSHSHESPVVLLCVLHVTLSPCK